MSLLVPRFQINDEMPTLGQLVREAIQPELCKYRRFERGNRRILSVPGHGPVRIQEEDCRQIKGAAQEKDFPSGEGCMPQARKSPVAAPPFKVGDKVMLLVNKIRLNQYRGDMGVVTKLPEGTDDAVVKFGQFMWFIRALDLELIKPEPGEWRDCSEDMPDLPAGKYELRDKQLGFVSVARYYSLHQNVNIHDARIAFQYRGLP